MKKTRFILICLILAITMAGASILAVILWLIQG